MNKKTILWIGVFILIIMPMTKSEVVVPDSSGGVIVGDYPIVAPDPIANFTTHSNYTVYTNQSDYWGPYLWSASPFLNLSGTNADQNINVSPYNLEVNKLGVMIDPSYPLHIVEKPITTTFLSFFDSTADSGAVSLGRYLGKILSTSTSGTSYVGFDIDLDIEDPAQIHTLEGVRVTYGGPTAQTSGTRNIYGVSLVPNYDIFTSSGGTTNQYGLNWQTTSNAVTNGGQILNNYGVRLITGTQNNFNGEINDYGIWIENYDTCTNCNNSWSIWVDDGNSYFGGDINASNFYGNINYSWVQNHPASELDLPTLNASNITNEYWVNETGDTMTGQLTVQSGNGKIVTTGSAGSIIAQTDTGQPGGISFGNTADIGISQDGVSGGYDYDGGFIFRQKASNPDGLGEFIFIEEAGDWRFALPKSGANYGTYNPRSFIIAGPSWNNGSNFNCSLWGFDMLDCDTGGTGADLGVQDDFQNLGHATFNTTNTTSYISLGEATMWYNSTQTNIDGGGKPICIGNCPQ